MLQISWRELATGELYRYKECVIGYLGRLVRPDPKIQEYNLDDGPYFYDTVKESLQKRTLAQNWKKPH